MVTPHKDEQSFYAHGKLLLSGEYLVLKGAKSFAVPLKRGQRLHVQKSTREGLVWKAYHPGGKWFSAEFSPSLSVKATTDAIKSQKLIEILTIALELKNENNQLLNGKEITTHLEFDPNWGWGSSSTLISNIARWLDIDPYQLLAETFGGSGYDIACATAKSPIFYRHKGNYPPEVNPILFRPPFLEKLWVGYLNKKQSSAKAIKEHLANATNISDLNKKISLITRQMATEDSFENFMDLVNEHESIISSLIGLPTLKKRLFEDFPGTVKSLGAWGGDFFLVLSKRPDNEIKKYFQTKGLNILFRLKDIILNI